MVVPLKMVSHGTYFLDYILYSQSLPNIYRRVSGFFLDLHGLKVDGLWASSKLQKQKVWTSSQAREKNRGDETDDC